MLSLLSTLTSGAIVLSVLPAVQGHMAIWGPFVYGNDKGSGAVQPLANRGFNDWWFRGYMNDRPSEVLSITPGQDLHMDIACTKSVTQYGNRPSADACPDDSGSFHAGGTSFVSAGWSGNSESNLMGCALAIAYKSDASSVQPEDFIVMSIQEDCVRQRDTAFSIPANLPACPDGECTCAWFWQGKNSANEMYMNGFRCNVAGGVATASYPTPAAPRKNKVDGPTQPMYWANDRSNLDYTPDWATKPSYNSAWGWKNGAQTGAFSGLEGGENVPVNNSSDAQPSSTRNQWEDTPSQGAGPTSTASQWDRPQQSDGGSGWESSTSSRRRGGGRHRSSSAAAGTATWYNHAAQPTPPVEPVVSGVAGPAVDASVDDGSSPRPTACKRNSRSRRRAAGH